MIRISYNINTTIQDSWVMTSKVTEKQKQSNRWANYKSNKPSLFTLFNIPTTVNSV